VSRICPHALKRGVVSWLGPLDQNPLAQPAEGLEFQRWAVPGRNGPWPGFGDERAVAGYGWPVGRSAGRAPGKQQVLAVITFMEGAQGAPVDQ
jgi:hypothetical protein